MLSKNRNVNACIAGISREVLDLKYEGAPPISIVAPKFKDKPKVPYKPRQWEDAPFRNSARKDGLILRHWRRKGDVGSIGAAMPVTPADSNAASELETDDRIPTPIPDSPWAKYNVKIDRPKYTDTQYETHMKSEDWTKEETDYLVDLAYEFDLRWIVIADRYEYKPQEKPKESEDLMAVTVTATPRSQEDLKARYYDVAAKAMVLQQPLSSMSSSEFEAYEKMTKFDGAKETQRKRYVERLMLRTDEEKEEEEKLLKELSRIVLNQETLFTERKALYDRLEPAASNSRETFSTTMYQSSQGLYNLYQTLSQQVKNKEAEKKEKRRSLLEANDIIGGTDRTQRHSLGGTDKRASTSGESGRRQLSAREEARFGVGHPNERLTGGVQFRNERVTKAVQGKSLAKMEKINAALTELNIPPKLVMPTAKVVTAYENLIEKIKTLIETRKISDKLESEIKILKAQKELQEAKDRGEDIKEEGGDEKANQTGAGNDEEDNEEESKLETPRQVDETRVEDDDDDDNEDDSREEGEEAEKDDSDDAEARNQEDSNNESDSGSEDDANAEEDADADDADENEIADEVQDLQEDEEGETQEQEQEIEGKLGVDDEENGDEDEAMEEAAASPVASPAVTTKSDGPRKRSVGVISHVSNKSSKRQRR